MANVSGAVAIVHVDRSQALIFLHDPSNTGPFPTGAFLWSDTELPTPAELVTRSMWLSFVNRSLSEHLSITIGSDDATGLATSVVLSDTVVDVAASAVPSNPAKRLDLVERLVDARAA